MNNPTAEVNKCDSCGKVASATIRLKRCSACKRKMYCSVKCQKQDWKDGHKDVCRTLQSFQRALDNATFRGPDDPFWVSFLDQATVENVKKLYDEEIGSWEIRLDEHNNLVVKDEFEGTILGHGPCPEKSEDILKVIYACMIMPETDNRPRRPNSIFLGVDSKNITSIYGVRCFLFLFQYIWTTRRVGKRIVCVSHGLIDDGASMPKGKAY